MGEQLVTKEEEANKNEESPAPTAAPEAAPAPAEEKKEEAPPPPPAEQDKPKDASPPPPPVPVPVILAVEVHCTGCAKRIRRSLIRCKGVEAVDVDMAANQVTIKGAVNPQALCDRLRAKTKRDATIISPLPPPPPTTEGEEPAPPPPPAPPLVSEARTVELLVNMHCEACAQQLQSKMMRMKGVVSAQTDLAAGRLTLSATVDDDKIVQYIHRRTGKLASVVPPPEPPKEEEPPASAADAEAPKEEAPAGDGEKKEESAAGENKPAEDGKGAAEGAGEEKKEGGGGAGEEDQKPGKQEGVAVDGFPPEEMMKRMVYWPYGGAPGGGIHYKLHPADAEEAMMARRLAMHAMPPPLPPPHHHQHNPYAMMQQQQHQWAPPPPPSMPMYNNYNYGGSYMMERPPQMFSDENPNACVIS